VLGDDRGALAAAAGTVTSAVGRHAPRRERLRAGELVPRRLPRARVRARPAPRPARQGHALQGGGRDPAAGLRDRRERRRRAATHGPARARVLADRGAGAARAARAPVAHRRHLRAGRAGGAARRGARATQTRHARAGAARLPFPRDRRGARYRPPSAHVRRLPAAPARPRHPPLADDPRARRRDEPARPARRPAPRVVAMAAHRRAGARVERDPSGHGGADCSRETSARARRSSRRSPS